MRKLLKVLLKQLKEIMENALVYMKRMMEISIVPVNLIEKEINVVANYILEKYE
jgi:hypothetical protein